MFYVDVIVNVLGHSQQIVLYSDINEKLTAEKVNDLIVTSVANRLTENQS